MEHVAVYFILACAFGFFMAWGVGANDVANAMGTSVGSKALTIRQAIIVAAIFEAGGALLAGGQVTATIRGKIIDTQAVNVVPEVLVLGMLAALLAAGLWLLLASMRGWPVSTTHSIVGAIIGFGVIELGAHAIYWGKVTNIVLSWVLTPIISGTLAFLIFRSEQKLILNTDDPVANAKKYVPMYVFIMGFIISMVTFTKGLKHLGLKLSLLSNVSISIAIAFLIMMIGIIMLRQLSLRPAKNPRFDFKNVEAIFGVLMIFTACAMAFAHGSNDVANAIGPLAAVIGILQSGGSLTANSPIPMWILGLGAVGIVAGLAMYGYKVIATIGEQITELTPSRGFAAELATASTVVIASGTGLPISTTQTLVGAILGVGLARGISALRLSVIRNIFMSWVITLPAGALLAVLFFSVLKFIFM